MRAFGIEPPTFDAWADVVLQEALDGFRAPFQVYGSEKPLYFDDPAAALMCIRRGLEIGETFFVLWGTLKQEGESHQIASIRLRRHEHYFIEEEQDTVFGTTVHSLWSFRNKDDFAECVYRCAAGLHHARFRFYDLESVFYHPGQEIPEDVWSQVWAEVSELDPWDAGALPGEMVQTGVWRGLPIEITYRLPEDFDDRMNEAEMKGEGDAYLRTLVSRVRLGDVE